MKWVLLLVISYLLGNFSSGIIFGKLVSGIDIRQHGSGNTGTTNAFRVLGVRVSLLTLVGDCLKGILAAWIGSLLCGREGAMLAGVFAVIGHIWPVFFKFKGGKGIATSFGVLLIVQPLLGLFLLLTQGLILWLTRTMSIASVISALLLPIYNIVFHTTDWKLILFSVALSAVAVYSHRGNIERVLRGEEKPLEFRRR